ncbi:hypothetical protein NM688_g6998 [Phlebia brevispora]|uniref:Uncharacterized protein n=1 Tax=Phlebia brevispora TaxID=194682 RepID=A0ACC1SA49_9APHY|nr:hypothetical protein NM688_g6998 [Phlebia brevispora]
MSATAPNAEIISEYKANLITNYSITAAVAVVCYEFIAALRHERELVWKRRWTGATWLFLANRCYNYSFEYFLAVLETLPVIIIAVFSALRVLALLGRAYIPAAFTFALGLTPVALDLYQSAQVTFYYVDDSILGSSCYFNHLISPSVIFYKKYSNHITMVLTHLTATLAGTLSAIVADVIAISITWIKTYRHVREASSVGADVGLSAALLRYGKMLKSFVEFVVDRFKKGSLYFINCTQSVVHHISRRWTRYACLVREFPQPSLQLADPIEAFTTVLPNIMLSRFLVNLRHVNAQESASAARFSRFSPPNFHMPSIVSIIGNLGEPLVDHEDDLDDDDHVIAEAYEDGIRAAANSGETVETSDVRDIGSDEIEVPAELV